MNILATKYDCPQGCSEGACINSLPASCVDSDNGKNFFNKGTATFIHPKTRDAFVETDYCFDSAALNEVYCEEDYKIGNELYICPDGCSNGACLNVDNTIPTRPAPEPYRDIYLECQFYSFSNNSVVGNLCFDKDNLALNCTTLESRISSTDGKTNYYGSKCNFTKSVQAHNHFDAYNDINVSGYCDDILTQPDLDNEGTLGYFRFYCGPRQDVVQANHTLMERILNWFKRLFGGKASD